MKTKLQLIRLILAGFLLISLQADEIVDNAKFKSTERFQQLFEKYHQSKSKIQSQRTQQENLQEVKFSNIILNWKIISTKIKSIIFDRSIVKNS